MEITNIPICMRYPQKYETTMAICKIYSEEKRDIFINILDPRSDANRKDGIGDLDYVAQLAVQWPHDTAFILRENMDMDFKSKNENNHYTARKHGNIYGKASYSRKGKEKCPKTII